jgi:hypothetical protein
MQHPNLKIWSSLLLATPLLFTACLTDDSSDSKPSSSSGASSSAMSSSGQVLAPCLRGNVAATVLGDYKSAQLRVVGLGAENSACDVSLSVYKDASVFLHEGFAYVLQKFGANSWLKVSLETGKVVWEKPLKSGANPHDLEFMDSKTAAISYYDEAEVVLVSLENGDVLQTKDLSSFKGSATVKSPSADDLYLYQGSLYLALQRMDENWTAKNSMVLKLDPKTLEVQDQIVLRSPNPFQIIADAQGSLYAISKGNTVYDESYNESSLQDGGVDLLDFAKDTSEILLTEKDLGGKPTAAAEAKDGKFWLAVYKSFGDETVWNVDLSARKVGSQLAGIADAQGGLASVPAEDLLIIGDRSFGAPGLFVFQSGKQSQRLFDKEMPPLSVTVR